jgi:hypothetical protein
MSLRSAANVLPLCLLACHPAPPPALPYDFSKGEDVIVAMHDRYYARWPVNLLMVQHNVATPTQADTIESVWLTAVVPPDRLRIDVVPRDLANGVLVLRDTQYVITNARPTQISHYIHPLLLLQHAVYFIPAPATIRRLREIGVNVDRVAQDRWDGRRMWVLGDPPNAQGSRQIWIDRDLLLLVRFLEPSPRDRTMIAETRLLQYESMNSTYVPRLILQFENGRQVFRQDNRQIRANQRLDTLLFLPDTWTQGRHWYQQALIR